jgi:hypothetical protein
MLQALSGKKKYLKFYEIYNLKMGEKLYIRMEENN